MIQNVRDKRNAYQRSNVGIGLLVQQQLSDSVVATVGRDVQRREVVQRDIINGRLVLQQQFHAFYVVSLGGHVQRGQSVLRQEKSESASDKQEVMSR